MATSEQIFADQEELPTGKDAGSAADADGAFVDLPVTPGGFTTATPGGGDGGADRGGAAASDGATAQGSGVDGPAAATESGAVDGAGDAELPVPPDSDDYHPSRTGVFGDHAPDGAAAEDGKDPASAFQEANLTITPTHDEGQADGPAEPHQASASKSGAGAAAIAAGTTFQPVPVTEISKQHFDTEAGSSGGGGGGDTGDVAPREEAFIKLAPPAGGADPLTSAIDDGKQSDDDDGSVDAMSIPVPGIGKRSSGGGGESSPDGSSGRRSGRSSVASAAGSSAAGDGDGDGGGSDDGGGGDEDDEDARYTPNPTEVFDRTGAKVLVPHLTPAREKRGFGQISLTDELAGQDFADALDEMPPAKQFGAPVQAAWLGDGGGAATGSTVLPGAGGGGPSPFPSQTMSPSLSSGPVKRASGDALRPLGTGSGGGGGSGSGGGAAAASFSLKSPAVADQKRAEDGKPSFSVKRSRQDAKATSASAARSIEVLDGDKRCKRAESPQAGAGLSDDVPFDVIITLGGGVTAAGEPTPWVVARLRDGNIKYDSPDVYHLLLSRGTTHKAPPKDRFGFDIEESTAMTKYLHDHGIDARRIIKDIWSLDTIGNAYFARCMVCEPRRFRRVLVVTSAFHMPRAESIFRHVFSCDALGKFRLEFLSTQDEGLAPAQRKARQEKEAVALEAWEVNKARLETLADISTFVFTDHNAYNARGRLASLDGAADSASPAKGAARPGGGVSAAADGATDTADTADATTAKNLLDTY